MNTSVLPGRHYLYPGKNIKAVESRDYCSVTGSSVPPHEKPPAKNKKDNICICTCNADNPRAYKSGDGYKKRSIDLQVNISRSSV